MAKRKVIERNMLVEIEIIILLVFIPVMLTAGRMEQPAEQEERERLTAAIEEQKKNDPGDYVNISSMEFADNAKEQEWYIDENTIQVYRGQELEFAFDVKYDNSNGEYLTSKSNISFDITTTNEHNIWPDAMNEYGRKNGSYDNLAHVSMEFMIDFRITNDFDIHMEANVQFTGAFNSYEKNIHVIVLDKDNPLPSVKDTSEINDNNESTPYIPPQVDYDLDDADIVNEMIEEAIEGEDPSDWEDFEEDIYEEYMSEKEE
uniref:hypothetical protein n=1 Tax=Candidatus Enterococcus willemsii TaxID=1857215 RepID=UPI00403F979A